MSNTDFQEAFYLVFSPCVTFILAWVLAGGVLLALIDVFRRFAAPAEKEERDSM